MTATIIATARDWNLTLEQDLAVIALFALCVIVLLICLWQLLKMLFGR